MGWAEMKCFKCREMNQWENYKKRGGRGFDQKICPRADRNLSWGKSTFRDEKGTP